MPTSGGAELSPHLVGMQRRAEPMVGGPVRVDSWQPPYKVHSPPSPWQGSDHTDSLTRP